MQAGGTECDAIQYEVKVLMVNEGYRKIGTVRRRRSLANVSIAESSPHRPVEDFPAECNPGMIYLSGFDLAVPNIDRPVISPKYGLGADYTYSEC